ncbi:hypothetical protein Y032_0085g1861 [Ancylostoma ceylanicum]|uniref:DUF19 domain-containing protein n=1 Tax=Ancylostoma ceylanicum TaxID=53326 RepID=A0A016TPG6_9BILA|nr:hypothetical protein Y032_0085g1861 [Ancylostoma ceylanicum]
MLKCPFSLSVANIIPYTSSPPRDHADRSCFCSGQPASAAAFPTHSSPSVDRSHALGPPNPHDHSDVQHPTDGTMNLLGLLLVCFLPVVFASHCPSHISSRIQECVRPVAEYAKLLNNNQDSSRNSASEIGNAFSLPNMGGRVFNELCKLIAKFNVCVREFRAQCVRHVTISLIDSSYGYLCNEGYNTFMESAECLMELDRKPAVKRCHDETLVEIETANTETGIAMAAKLDRMCGALNFFAGCVKTPIKQECGSSAWQVIYRVLKDTTNTLMPGCQFTGASARLLSVEAEEHHTHPVTSTAATTTTAPPPPPMTTPLVVVEEFAYPAEVVTVSGNSRKGMKKNIVSQELSQLNGSSRITVCLLLFIVMLC